MLLMLGAPQWARQLTLLGAGWWGNAPRQR